MGSALPFDEIASQTGLRWAATQSNFAFAAVLVTTVVEFLSPIEVGNASLQCQVKILMDM
jgi:hypothetical protein